MGMNYEPQLMSWPDLISGCHQQYPPGWFTGLFTVGMNAQHQPNPTHDMKLPDNQNKRCLVGDDIG